MAMLPVVRDEWFLIQIIEIKNTLTILYVYADIVIMRIMLSFCVISLRMVGHRVFLAGSIKFLGVV